MPLILEQKFPLGRFHATRWNQNPFEDRHGEWPPSPWRLLRALAARWFQYSRETGDEDETVRNELLSVLASQPPSFHIPASTWRGEPAPRQYHKTEVAWTDAAAKASAYKKPKSSFVVDAFRAVAPDAEIVWCWENVELSQPALSLLEELLTRVVYFGRAETHCRIALRSNVPSGLELRELTASNRTGSPVLVPTPGTKLDLDILLASSDDKLLKGRSIPPGTEWRYAILPKIPATARALKKPSQAPVASNVFQFAVGGRVFPEFEQWVCVVEKFRGCVLKHAARLVSNRTCSSYGELPTELKERLKLLSGKDGTGAPLQNHEHTHFFMCPDEHCNPTRLVVYRRAAFEAFEVDAMFAASNDPVVWNNDSDWSLRLVPLPVETPVPPCCSLTGSTIWSSATPFVPPNRRRFRKNGRLRAGETATVLLERALIKALCEKKSNAKILRLQPVDQDGHELDTRADQDPAKFDWVIVHESGQETRDRKKKRERRIRRGFRYHIEFSEPVAGPLLAGHSCHFGLGLFAPDDRVYLGKGERSRPENHNKF